MKRVSKAKKEIAFAEESDHKDVMRSWNVLCSALDVVFVRQKGAGVKFVNGNDGLVSDI